VFSVRCKLTIYTEELSAHLAVHETSIMIDCKYVGKVEENLKLVCVQSHITDTGTFSVLLQYGDELNI
jgi:hypothetical protein